MQGMNKAAAELYRFVMEQFRPPKLQTVSEWADENRLLVSESSATPGRWRTSRAPYQKDIMDAFTEKSVWQIVIMASAQVGKTEIELNMMGRAIDADPGPMLFVQPTDAFAEDFSKRRVAPMIKACPALQNKVYEAKSRDAGNTISMKTFPGGSVAFTGANSPTQLAGRPVRYVFMDEIDRFPISAGTEGDPIKLAERRTETYRTNRKIIKTSTPIMRNASKIEKAYRNGTQEKWVTECPLCREYSFITFDNIRFEKDEYEDLNGDKDWHVSNVRWVCPMCGAEMTEREAKKAPSKWRAENPEALKEGIRSFRLNAFMSPFSDWGEICREFLKSKDDPELLKVFKNTMLGETWEARDARANAESLLYRREGYPAEVPDGVLVLTMGVDTQDNRLEWEVVGWDRDEQSWGICKGIIPGRADMPETWEGMDRLLDREWTRENGEKIKVSAAFMDSGGHFTQDVYRECAARMPKRLFAVKGEGGDKPYVRMMKRDNGRDSGVRFLIGVDSGKEAIMYATTVTEEGPRYMHFPKNGAMGYDLEYFKGLVSEKMELHKKLGQSVIRWEKVYERNEPLDCRNYARAAYKYFNWDFERLEREARGEMKEEMPYRQKRKRDRVLSKGVVV
jgi:phage terminase large subunit GpA-like protein